MVPMVFARQAVERTETHNEIEAAQVAQENAAGCMKASSIRMEAPLIHIPSVFFNRGEWNSGYNYGRIEHDTLHNVSAAVQAMASPENDVPTARAHIATARKLLDRLEELTKVFPVNG